MAVLVVLLRAIHIVGGLFWAGSVITLYGFVMPSVAATRPESGKFVQHLAAMSGITFWMTVASAAAVIGGLGLFAPVSGGFDRDVMRSPRGMAISLGALIGLLVFLEGQIVSGPAARKLGAISKAIAASGGAPSAEQARQMGELQAKLGRVGTRGAWLLGVTATLMAVARYL